MRRLEHERRRWSRSGGPVVPTEQAWRAGVAEGIRLSQIVIRKGGLIMGHDGAGTAVRTHVVTGYPAQVRAALQRAAMDGRLAGVGSPVELPGRRVRVTAELHEPARARRSVTAADVWRWLRPVLLVLLVAAVAGGAVWGVVLLVEALIAALAAFGVWLAAQLPLIIAIGVGLLLLAVPAGARCVGVHCGGCRR